MGLTPLTGLPGATRSGAVDPSLIFHYTNRAGRMSHDRSQAVNVHVTLAEEILNKKSGWKAITGTTDFGEIVKHMKENAEKVRSGTASDDEAKWQLAYDLFVDRILEFVGSYYLKLGGEVDAVVFSGGIGERSVELRDTVVGRMKCLGFELDDAENAGVGEQEGEVIEIGVSRDNHRVLVCRTDEQVSTNSTILFVSPLTKNCSWRWRENAPSRNDSGLRTPKGTKNSCTLLCHYNPKITPIVAKRRRLLFLYYVLDTRRASHVYQHPLIVAKARSPRSGLLLEEQHR